MGDRPQASGGASGTALADVPYAATVSEVLDAFTVDEEGLSVDEAARRLIEGGANGLPAERRPHPVVTFLKQFHDVLIYVLLASAIVTFVVGDWIDAIVILAVTVVNAVIGVIQAGRSQKALDGIRAMLSLRATARRGGHWVTVEAVDLVTGDVIRVDPGDKVPADARLIGAHTLQVDESALTGESLPSDKALEPVSRASGVGDRDDMLFSGTHVTAGAGTAVVTAVGLQTEIGRIHALVTRTESTATPLTRQLARFSTRISLLILAVAAAMLAVGRVVHDRDVADLVPATIGFAVAAIPEGLPALVTITLALGVRQMASHNAIVRKLTAVETLGSVTTICTDKTGTLTRNEMTVRTVVTPVSSFDVSGVGYAPHGTITTSSSAHSSDTSLLAVVQALALCNDAHLIESDGAWGIVGDPTEGALATLAAKAGVDTRGATRLALVPFSAETKSMAVRSRSLDDRTHVFLKGAPTVVLDACSHQVDDDGRLRPLDRAAWTATVEQLSSRGLRVLAAARSAETAPTATLLEGDYASDMVFLGVVGIADPPRAEAVDSITTLHAAGVRVKMITGDHPGTALAIATEMGIAAAGSAVLTGADIEGMSDAELADRAPDVDVYARTSPEHKLRIVAALQARGQTVAMTGDGVNDAPALRRADIGVAMGIKGTETTKEAADIVLADDDFATVGHAVEEGRRIRDNLQKSILFLLPTTSAQALVVLLAVVIGFTLPLQATQILWVNLITAVTLSLALATEPAEPGIMTRPPTTPGRGILDRSFVGRIIWVSALITTATIGVFFFEIAGGASDAQAQTTAVTMLTLGQLAFLFSCRFLRASSLRVAVLRGNRAIWVSSGVLLTLQLVFVYAPFMHPWFHSAPLGVREWAYTAAIAVVIFLLTEAGKALERTHTRSRQLRPSVHVS